MKLCALILILLCITACSGPFSSDEGKARNQLLAISPIGSDAKLAVPKIEALGFKCEWHDQQGFADIIGKHNYLYCDKQVMVFPLLSRRWQLALIHNEHIVHDAKFGISLVGL